jgi:hypothetical protein
MKVTLKRGFVSFNIFECTVTLEEWGSPKVSSHQRPAKG